MATGGTAAVELAPPQPDTEATINNPANHIMGLMRANLFICFSSVGTGRKYRHHKPLLRRVIA
jgi:hypothetical protein